MADSILMTRGPASMYVPPHKVAAFLADGWTVAADRPAAEVVLPAAVEVFAPVAAPEPEPVKRKATKAAKADN